MVDKQALMKMAYGFQKEVGTCFIHTEMKKGKGCETILCGDFLAMLHGINAEISRISELTGNSYEETWMTIRMMHEDGGFQNVMSKVGNNAKYREIEGQDWQEDWKKAKEKELKKSAEAKVLALELENRDIKKRCTSLNNQLVDIKKKDAKIIKAKDKQIQDLSKECLTLEHKLNDMENALLLANTRGN